MFEDEKESEEEISIDFGRIKNFFKKKKKKEGSEGGKEIEKPKEAEDTETPKKETDHKEKNIQKEVEKTEIKKEENSEDDDEVISLDFSKVTKFFRKKEEKQVEEEKKVDDSEEDEISLDFSKIKGFFKGKKESKEKVKESDEETSDEEVSFDFRKILGYIKQHKKVLIPLIIILFAMSLSIYLRVQSAYLPVTDSWARDSVYNFMRSQISGQINQQYPNLPDSNKNALVESEFQKVLQQQKGQLEEQIKGTSNQFKSRLQNDKGQTYLLAIDPYFWMRQAKNIIEKGHTGDEIRDGVPWDNHMFAPFGRPNPPDVFHPYFEAYVYKIWSFFDRDVELMKVAFYIPVIISALSIIPAFFISRRLGGNFGALIATIMLAISPAFLNRTAGGFADTDAYNVFFPLLITWLFLEALESNKIKNAIIPASGAGLLVGIYSRTWGGWWYILDFIIAAYVIYLVYYLIIHRKEIIDRTLFKHSTIKNILIIGIIFLVSSAVFVSVFLNFYSFRSAFLAPLEFTKIKEVGVAKIWPNVLTTVAEQNEASTDSIISNIGGKFLFLIALIGILLSITKKDSRNISDLWFIILATIWFIIILSTGIGDLKIFLVLLSIPIIIKLILLIIQKEHSVNIRIAILLIIWVMATVYAGTKGIRWILLLVPAFSIAFGIALGIIYKYLHSIITKEFKINKILSKTTVIILLLLLLINPWNSAKSVARNELPSMNDAWYNSLDKINREAAPDAIINSWWDFGHWFKAIGDRAVTFDGTSQDTPQAHWVGHSLLTDNEDIAVGILRMLDCGGNRAFDELNPAINDSAHSIEILYSMIVLDKEGARKILSSHQLDDEEIDAVLRYTHCDPPENYFITSDDMIQKSGVWAHFGSWNFNRAQIYNTLNKKGYKKDKQLSLDYLMERFNYTEKEADNVYYDVQSLTTSKEVNDWIAPWPGYGSRLNDCSKLSNETFACPIGGGTGLLNATTMDFYIPTSDGIKHPDVLVYPVKEGIVKKHYNNTIGMGMALMPSGGSFKNIIMSPELTGSMFTRLFFMEGHGLAHFKKFSDETSVFGNRIIVWKVDWEGKEKNNLPQFLEPIEEAIPDEEVSEEVELSADEPLNTTKDIKTESITNSSANIENISLSNETR